jgi:hypothetical protein
MYMVMSRDQNAGQNGYIQIGNKSFETVDGRMILKRIFKKLDGGGGGGKDRIDLAQE